MSARAQVSLYKNDPSYKSIFVQFCTLMQFRQPPNLNHLCMIDVFAINSSISKILVLLPYKHSLSEKRNNFLANHSINISI